MAGGLISKISILSIGETVGLAYDFASLCRGNGGFGIRLCEFVRHFAGLKNSDPCYTDEYGCAKQPSSVSASREGLQVLAPPGRAFKC